ncbi:META domain-containing protein [Pleurocapsa sp. PCC 7319]|uniref:META domain-containing protein n=1 Tax=Pleurocapsa sp. PCC 7319 TaxID=118161 RepID=UPI0003453CCB|nr:META domain-containing protein [Pleurocapsa sp. PCC 7319]
MNTNNCLSILCNSGLGLLSIGLAQSLFNPLLSPPAIAVPPPVSDSNLEDPWQLMQWEEGNTTKPVARDTEITVQFSEETISGSGGCNNYNGSFNISKMQLKVGDLAATRKACLPQVMEQEFQYMAALQGAQRFEITKAGKLRISYQSVKGSGVLVFEQSGSQTSNESWLDTASQNWNLPGQAVPRAPIQVEDNLPYCTESFRTASLPEDRSVEIGGWMLYGPAQVFGSTTIISGMVNADAQCRPMNFQYFVFKEGDFVGTLSPSVMNSHSDGSLSQIYLFREDEIVAVFDRYQDSDPQCCASSETSMYYSFKETSKGMVLEPQNFHTLRTSSN